MPESTGPGGPAGVIVPPVPVHPDAGTDARQGPASVRPCRLRLAEVGGGRLASILAARDTIPVHLGRTAPDGRTVHLASGGSDAFPPATKDLAVPVANCTTILEHGAADPAVSVTLTFALSADHLTTRVLHAVGTGRSACQQQQHSRQDPCRTQRSIHTHPPCVGAIRWMTRFCPHRRRRCKGRAAGWRRPPVRRGCTVAVAIVAAVVTV